MSTNSEKGPNDKANISGHTKRENYLVRLPSYFIYLFIMRVGKLILLRFTIVTQFIQKTIQKVSFLVEHLSGSIPFTMINLLLLYLAIFYNNKLIIILLILYK